MWKSRPGSVGLETMSEHMSHHLKTAASQQTTVAIRNTPNFSLPFKLNKSPNHVLEIRTSVLKPRRGPSYHTTYQLATLHKVGQESPRGAGHPEDFLGMVCNFWSRLADSLRIHSFIHSFIQPTHSAFLHSIVPVLI